MGLFKAKGKLNKKVLAKYNAWIRDKYAKRFDPENIYPIGITDTEFRQWIVRLFLGDDWYIVDPLGHDQCNEKILEEIIFNVEGKHSYDD